MGLGLAKLARTLSDNHKANVAVKAATKQLRIETRGETKQTAYENGVDPNKSSLNAATGIIGTVASGLMGGLMPGAFTQGGGANGLTYAGTPNSSAGGYAAIMGGENKNAIYILIAAVVVVIMFLFKRK